MVLNIARIIVVGACLYLLYAVSDANAQSAKNQPPSIGFVEPLPIDVVSQRAFKVCAYVKDQEGDPIKVIFTPMRSTRLSVSLAKANKCAWFTAPERRGMESVKVVAYEIRNPSNRSEFDVPICILMDELFGGVADPTTDYCPRL